MTRILFLFIVSLDCLEDNKEYRGNYLTNMVSKGPGDCQRLCQENDQCTFWSMATENIRDWRRVKRWLWGYRWVLYVRYRPNHCWLHSGNPGGKNRGNFMRGPKNCVAVDGGWSEWASATCSVSCDGSGVISM